MNSSIPENTSKRITSLRFLLACLVVFIHNTLPSINDGGGQLYSYHWIKQLISVGLGCSAVPLFFTFSAYLQAKKSLSYPKLLKKRAKSILLPYILWIFIYLIYELFGKLFISKIMPSALSETYKPIQEWTFIDYIVKIFGYGKRLCIADTDNPGVAGQFWFMRDLMILIIISPLLTYCIKKIPTALFALILILSFLNTDLIFVSNSALLFYLIGLYWGTYDIPLLEKIDCIHWYEIVSLFLLALLAFSTIFSNNALISSVLVIFSATLILKVSATLILKESTFQALYFLSKFSFFLYAIHLPIVLAVIKTLWCRIIPLTNSFFCLLEYFGVSFITIILGTALAMFLKRICPNLFGLLNGGR